jgi:hypothetical protein
MRSVLAASTVVAVETTAKLAVQQAQQAWASAAVKAQPTDQATPVAVVLAHQPTVLLAHQAATAAQVYHPRHSAVAP